MFREYKKKVDSDKSSENVPKLESVEVVLVYSNLVKNEYQHTSKVLVFFGTNNLNKLLIRCLNA